MLRNFLKVAVRNLLRNKLYLIVNTIGVGIAIGCAMTSYLLVAYNIEFDNTVDEDRVANIVKVVHHRRKVDGEPYKELVAPMALAPVAAQDITGINSYSRFCSTGGYMSFGGEGFHETIFFADATFMDMFQPELIAGSYDSFNERNTVFINEKYANKYFGKEPALGKELNIQINGRKMVAVVGGILKDAPFNSTFTQNVLMRIENFLALYNINENEWTTSESASTLFELSDINNRSTIAAQMNKYVRLKNDAVKEANSISYELLPFLQPLSPNDVRQSDLHLRIPNIALGIFTMLGAIILLIACFNLTNTTLAMSMKRFKEIGVRKVVGSRRHQITIQFLMETGITVALAVVTGFALSLVLIPEFASMWQLPYGFKDLNALNMLIALIVLLAFVALLAGIYPALHGSRQSPILLFKGGQLQKGTNGLTRSLLVGQFALSVLVLIAGTTFTRNATWQESINFGYDKHMLMTALIQGQRESAALSNALQSNPNVQSSSASVHHFGFINAPRHNANLGDDKFQATVYEVGPSYLSTVGLSIVSGRFFNPTDTLSRNEVVVDENFVRRRALTNPLGTTMEFDGTRCTIVGVVTNHLTDLKSDNTENYVYRLAKPQEYLILVVRGVPEQLAATEKMVQSEWKKLYPDQPLRTDLQQEILHGDANGYNHNLGKIFLFMTLMGCTLSLTGLYSLATLNISKRQKEIGIRKVLGASVLHLVRLVNREFAIILTVAVVVGAFGGYALTEALLSDLFRQHIGVAWLPVILCGCAIFAAGIAATTVTIARAAVTNPVNVLKNE